MLLTATAYIAISIISVLVVLFIVYRILRRLVVRTNSNSLFGGDAKTFLLSLALAVIPFPTVLPTFVRAVARFVIDLVRFIGGALKANWDRLYATPNQTDPSPQAIIDLGFGFLSAWTDSIVNAYNNIPPYLPYMNLIFLLALWALLAYLLNQTPSTDGTNIVRGRAWLQNAFNYSRLNPSAVRNLLFFLILGLGAYLSIAAIAAIPSLQEESTETEAVGVTRLKGQLEGLQGQFANNVSEELVADDPFETVEIFLNDRMEELKKQEIASAQPNNGTTAGNQPVPATPVRNTSSQPIESAREGPSQENGTKTDNATQQFLAENIKSTLNAQRLNRHQLLGLYRTMISRAKGELQVAVNKGVAQYSANIGRKGHRERARHFLDITNWYDERSSYFTRDLNNCSSFISFMDVLWKSWADRLRDDLATRPNSQPDLGPKDYFAEAIPVCQIREKEYDIAVPDRQPLGFDLGAFRYLVGWLLKTESLALALITGLFGFGLLGSACSTFVREREQKRIFGTNPDIIVEDLTGVVIRGVSAAIVVFLAVEGGLAIFASPNSQPNSYVLLLTCLVAAVFSEVIWTWAQSWITGYFNSDTEAARQQQEARLAQARVDASQTDEEISLDQTSTSEEENNAADDSLRDPG
jgi:hypothetical protein